MYSGVGYLKALFIIGTGFNTASIRQMSPFTNTKNIFIITLQTFSDVYGKTFPSYQNIFSFATVTLFVHYRN
jgi:hypothetical protein